MIDLKEIKENYKNYSDSDIEHIATFESKSLRKEVLDILKNEIEDRNLDKDLITWVEAETDPLSGSEKQTIINKIEYMTCPNCQQNSGKLRGYEINQIVSFIFGANSTNESKILCEYCGRKKKLNSMLITLFAGWWSRRGILLTPYTIVKDLTNLFFQEKISKRILNEFLEINNGLIRIHGTDKETLTKLILIHNNNYEIEEETE